MVSVNETSWHTYLTTKRIILQHLSELISYRELPKIYFLANELQLFTLSDTLFIVIASSFRYKILRNVKY